MRKKSIAAMLLALSLTMGTATMTGCDLIGFNPDNNNPGITDPETVAVTGVSIGEGSFSLAAGGTKSLTATVSPSNASNKNVSWSSGNTAVATVDQNGVVTAVAEGTAVITVTTEDGNKTATCTVTVTKNDENEPPVDPDPDTVAVTGVQISDSTAVLEIGGVKTLNATVLPTNATNKNVGWSSNNAAVATVDQTGKVTAKAAGTAKITVTTVDGSKTAVCTVTVNAAVPDVVHVTGVQVSDSAAVLEIGGVKALTVTVLPTNATNKNVSWSSDNTSVATVNQNGEVTAVSAGTANIKVTAEDGGLYAVCSVTVNAPVQPDPDPEIYEVKFYSDGVLISTVEVEEGKTVTPPSDVKKEGHYLTGWGTSAASGVNFDFTQGVTGNLSLYAKWQVVAEGISYTYAGNECAAFEWEDGNPDGATVEYKLSSATAFSAVDAQLVRAAAETGFARVDIVGLKGGAKYDFKITTSAGETLVVSDMTVFAYDRSGYAHFGTSGVGAYNDDGTPKANANIVYVSEANKNSTFRVENKDYTGIVGLLKNASALKNPLIVRVIGTVGAATWNQIEYNPDGIYSATNKISADKIVGINGKQLPTATTSQADLIAGGYNTLDESVYDELLGLTSQITYSSGAYDSCWNDCRIPNAENITVEGIGEDARLFQWGMTFQKCNSIEVRNLTFEDYTEDACSFEASSDSDTSSTSPDGFTYKNFWVHHNTFEEGINYWDVSDEQDKHDGDGSTDVKRIAYVTFSYNVYNNTHKTGLVGSSNTVYTASVTFHHNVYNNCKARLPLARQANMHMYNNYYNGTTSTDLSLRANAYAFVENCYFESGNNCPVELQRDDTNGNGAAKLVGCIINQSRIKIADGVASTNLGVNVGREDTVTNGNKYGQTFDTNSSLFYCKTVDGHIITDVTNMLTAEQTKEIVPKLAGVQKRGGDVTLGGTTGGDSGEGGDVTEPTEPSEPTDPTPGGDVTSSVAFNASNCGIADGGLLTETDNGLFGLVTADDGKKFNVTALLAAGGGTQAAANDNSGLVFDKVFLSSGTGGTMTLTAKENITVTVYYTVTNSAFNTTDQSKSGYLKWTVNGGAENADTDTGNKSGRTAYAVTISLSKGDVCVMTASANRLAVFGFVANLNA